MTDARTDCCPPVTESPLSEEAAAPLARIFAALGDPVRLRLLSMIAASGELCSCDLLEPLAKSQPTISHHTSVLADAGLITGRKDGRWTYWSVAPEHAAFVAASIDERPSA